MVFALPPLNPMGAQTGHNSRAQQAYTPRQEEPAPVANTMPMPTQAGEVPPSYVRLKNYAPLVAQLAATAQNMPQTRILRRAESADGAASYTETATVMRGRKVLPSWEA